MDVIAGIDIGGTKCAVSFLEAQGENPVFLSKEKVPTDEPHPEKMVQYFVEKISGELEAHKDWSLKAIGISCGGPLDERKRADPLSSEPSSLGSYRSFYALKRKIRGSSCYASERRQCLRSGRMAAWSRKRMQKYDFSHLWNRAWSRTDLEWGTVRQQTEWQGEAGRYPSSKEGPVGCGKKGSFEGFSNGGRMPSWKKSGRKALQEGKQPLFCKNKEELEDISARTIAEAAEKEILLHWRFLKQWQKGWEKAFLS